MISSYELLARRNKRASKIDDKTADLLEGKPVDQENYRRNVAMLGQLLIKLGMAAKSRDVTKASRAGSDYFDAALIEANHRKRV